MRKAFVNSLPRAGTSLAAGYTPETELYNVKGPHLERIRMYRGRRKAPMAPSADQKRALIEGRFTHWHYRYDLGDGIVTTPFLDTAQNWHDQRREIIFGLIRDRFGSSLRGKTCLDVACNSGFWSFALAELHPHRHLAIDDQAYLIEQAEFVRNCFTRHSKYDTIEFRHQSVFDLEAEADEFDLVLFLGLAYHLTDIVGAIERVYRVTRGTVIVDSCVSRREGLVLEFSDPAKFRGIGPKEFSFVPTCPALIRILEHVGFSSVDRWTPMPSAPAPYREGDRVIVIAMK